jgi:succinate dehydrogenase/fumarate reductase flavoprotein subunit
MTTQSPDVIVLSSGLAALRPVVEAAHSSGLDKLPPWREKGEDS